jgi:hypothetical protein
MPTITTDVSDFTGFLVFRSIVCRLMLGLLQQDACPFDVVFWLASPLERVFTDKSQE